MEEASRVRGGGPAPQIVGTMENMKLALRLRLSRGPLSEEQINAVAAAIDGEATSVERTCGRSGPWHGSGKICTNCGPAGAHRKIRRSASLHRIVWRPTSTSSQ
jgi:hypothetical protein